MKKIFLILLSLILFSCRQTKTLDLLSVAGQYSSLDTADFYTNVLLRSDSTYVIDQFPGEFHFQNMGQWTIQGDTIVLFNGVEFSDSLLVEEERDSKSDMLTIDIAALQPELGDRVKFSINNIDLEVTHGKILIRKSDFWTGDYFNDDYEYVPVNLDIRIRNGFARVQYIFKAKTLHIKLQTRPAVEINSSSVLCKYYQRDSVLYSSAEFYEIERHSLRRDIK